MKLTTTINLLALASSALALAAPNEAKRSPEALPQGACPDAGDVHCTPVPIPPKRDIEARMCGDDDAGCTPIHLPTKRAADFVARGACPDVGPCTPVPVPPTTTKTAELETRDLAERRVCPLDETSCPPLPPKRDVEARSCRDAECSLPTKSFDVVTRAVDKRQACPDGDVRCTPVGEPEVACPRDATDCPPPLTKRV